MEPSFPLAGIFAPRFRQRAAELLELVEFGGYRVF